MYFKYKRRAQRLHVTVISWHVRAPGAVVAGGGSAGGGWVWAAAPTVPFQPIDLRKIELKRACQELGVDQRVGCRHVRVLPRVVLDVEKPALFSRQDGVATAIGGQRKPRPVGRAGVGVHGACPTELKCV